MAGANVVVPDGLKQIKPYITLAIQLDQKNEKSIAYYCRLYAVQQGMAINKSAPDCKKFLLQQMDLVENVKNNSKNDEAISTLSVGQACMEQYALRIFDKADEDDRQAKFNKNLVKQFYTAGLLFDCLTFFEELSEDLVAKKQYAKRKAMYLNRCFQTGETPIAGPLVGEDRNHDEEQNTNEEHNSNVNYNSSGANAPYPTNNRNYYDEPTPNPRPRSSATQPTEKPTSNYYEESNDSPQASFPPELLQKAQKYCKFATSALQYEDIATAITNLEQCLHLLKTGK